MFAAAKSIPLGLAVFCPAIPLPEERVPGSKRAQFVPKLEPFKCKPG